MNFLTSIHPERSDFRLHRAYFRPERAEYKPGRVDLWSKRADFGPKPWPKIRTDFGSKKVDFGSERANYGPERGDFGSERVDLGLLGRISGLKEPDLGLRGLGGGDVRTDVRTYGRTDVRTDGRKEIHPCVLQDIGPLGPLPKKLLKRSFSLFSTRADGPTDGRTDGPTDRRTDGQSLLSSCVSATKKREKGRQKKTGKRAR